MKHKIFVFLIAFVSVVNVCTGTAYAENNNEETTEAWTTSSEETVTKTTLTSEPTEEITSDNTISADEFYSQSENLQGQIDEIRQMFEENGYNIDGINGNMEGISAEIDGLQVSLDDLYTLLNTVQSNQSSSGAGTPQTVNAQQPATIVQTTEPKPTAVTTVTTTTVAADTSPNGYLVEKAEKDSDKRDFITVTTRDGHVFYIVIDYESDDKHVYFLNSVDTEDLKRILETGTSNNTEKPTESETQTVSDETGSAPKSEQSKPKNDYTLLLIIGVVAVVAFVFVIKKKLSGKKKYDDDDSDSDYNENDDFTEEAPEEFTREDTEENDEESEK